MEDVIKRLQEIAGERDWPEDFPHENGCYSCYCDPCSQTFMGHKRRYICKVCSNYLQRERNYAT